MKTSTLLVLGAGAAGLYFLLRKSGGLSGLGAANPCPKTFKYNKNTGQCACPGTKIASPTTGLCITQAQYKKQFGTLPITGQILCPAAAAVETQAAAMCSAAGQVINVTNCNPFEYTCGTGQQQQQGNCAYGYTWNGYSCVYSAQQGNCAYGYTWNGYSCVYGSNIQQGNCAAGYSQQYQGGPCVYAGISTSYGSTMYPGQYSSQYMQPSNYSEPLIMPEDTGDGSASDSAEITDASSAEEGIASSYSGPELTPTSEASQQYNTDWYQTAPASLTSGGGSCPAGQGQQTSDQWGALQVVQTVCAKAGSGGGGGGYPSMDQVEQSDMSGLVGLGFVAAA